MRRGDTIRSLRNRFGGGGQQSPTDSPANASRDRERRGVTAYRAAAGRRLSASDTTGDTRETPPLPQPPAGPVRADSNVSVARRGRGRPARGALSGRPDPSTNLNLNEILGHAVESDLADLGDWVLATATRGDQKRSSTKASVEQSMDTAFDQSLSCNTVMDKGKVSPRGPRLASPRLPPATQRQAGSPRSTHHQSPHVVHFGLPTGIRPLTLENGAPSAFEQRVLSSLDELREGMAMLQRDVTELRTLGGRRQSGIPRRAPGPAPGHFTAQRYLMHHRPSAATASSCATSLNPGDPSALYRMHSLAFTETGTAAGTVAGTVVGAPQGSPARDAGMVPGTNLYIPPVSAPSFARLNENRPHAAEKAAEPKKDTISVQGNSPKQAVLKAPSGHAVRERRRSDISPQPSPNRAQSADRKRGSLKLGVKTTDEDIGEFAQSVHPVDDAVHATPGEVCCDELRMPTAPDAQPMSQPMLPLPASPHSDHSHQDQGYSPPEPPTPKSKKVPRPPLLSIEADEDAQIQSVGTAPSQRDSSDGRKQGVLVAEDSIRNRHHLRRVAAPSRGPGMLTRMLQDALLPAGAVVAREDPEVAAAARRIRLAQMASDSHGAFATMSDLFSLEEEEHAVDAEELKEPLVLLPDCALRWVWDLVYIMLVLFETCTATLALSTTSGGRHSIGDPPLPLYVVATLFWMADVWVQSRTAVRRGWEIDDDPASIWDTYIRQRLPVDAPLTLPWDIVAYAALGVDAFWYASSFRVLRLFRTPFLFKGSTPIRETPRWVEFSLFFFLLLLYMHVSACLWLVIATEEEQAISTRVFDDPLSAYSQALYFTVTTVTSVGYGDISPNHFWSRFLNILLQMSGVAILLFLSGYTAAWFITTDPFELMLLERRRRIQSLMRAHAVPWEIQKEAFTVYPVLLETSVRDFQEVMRELPDFVQDRIARHIKIRLLSVVPLFKGVSQTVLTQLAELLVEEYCDTHTYIIRAGDTGQEMWFLHHGVVEVLIPGKGGEEVWASNLTTGSYFGEIALLRETERVASVRSLSPCVLYKLDKSNIDFLIQASEELRHAIGVKVQRRLDKIRDVQEEVISSPRAAASRIRSRSRLNSQLPGLVTTPASQSHLLSTGQVGSGPVSPVLATSGCRVETSVRADTAQGSGLNLCVPSHVAYETAS